MRSPRLTDERGIALVVAVFALVVIGALIAGVFFAGNLEQQSGRNTFYVAEAAEAAEAGLQRTLATASGATYDAMPLGPPATDLGTITLTGNLTASREATRLTSSLWLIRAIGTRSNAAGMQATRTVASIVRLNKMNINIRAGLTALGEVEVLGNATVSGIDAIPPSWAEPPAVSCPAAANTTGILYNGSLNTGGSAVVTGQPAVQNDASLNAANIFGGSTFEQLKAMRTLTLTGNINGLAPVVTGAPARCDISVQSNWGAPTDKTSPCFTYFPVIYKLGDLSLSGTGEGQGILLVEGNLHAQGRIDFYGPVIVTGEVDVRGTGSDDVKFYGGIMAQNVALDDNRLTGNATVNFSSCAIQRAINGSATLAPIGERAWAQLYAN